MSHKAPEFALQAGMLMQLYPILFKYALRNNNKTNL